MSNVTPMSRDDLVEHLSEYILTDIRKRFPDDPVEMQDDLLWDPDIWRHGIFSDAQAKASKKLRKSKED